jgi:hypothetical protein
MNLAEFILARVAEDEEAGMTGGAALGDANVVISGALQRLAAECEAKRQIATIAEVLAADTDWYLRGRGEHILLALAHPYAPHPDFDPAWSVTA